MDRIAITILGYTLAAASLFFAWLQWRKSNEANELREQEQQELSVLKQKEKQWLSGQKTHQSQLHEKSKLISKLEKDLDHKHARLQAKVEELQAELEEKESEQQKLHGKVEHHKTQSETLLSQLQEIDQEKKEYRLKLVDLEKEMGRRIEEQTAPLAEQLKNANGKLKNLENKLKAKENRLRKAQEELKKVDPHALKKAKSKISQYNHLYNIMKGQKDLIADRNSNWELALRMLSTWICKQKSQAEQPENLGALVAQALELTKSGPLIAAKDDVSEEYKEELREIAREEKQKSRNSHSSSKPKQNPVNEIPPKTVKTESHAVMAEAGN
ncbi:MAG: hypothetical protein HRU09_20060 [Oligoflexales bacterium]|nr:hypothetical protein [Oligoflexales bacterium]